MTNNEKMYIKIPEAVEVAKTFGINITNVTAIKWVHLNHLGHQLGSKGARWVVHKRRWEDFLTGRFKQLPGIDYEE